jgi:ATP-dependent RNA circularization protein (DNA/RNA ligase family)
MDAATKFAGTVFSNSSAIAIKIGSYDLTGSEKNRIIAVVMSYNSLTEKYSLTNDLLATMETKDLIKKIKDLKWQLDNNENEGVKNNDDNDNIE